MKFESHENGVRLLEAEFDLPPPAAPGDLHLVCNVRRPGDAA